MLLQLLLKLTEHNIKMNSKFILTLKILFFSLFKEKIKITMTIRDTTEERKKLYTVVSSMALFLALEQKTLHFHLALGPRNYATRCASKDCLSCTLIVDQFPPLPSRTFHFSCRCISGGHFPKTLPYTVTHLRV